MSLPRALIIKQHFSFSFAAVFGGYWRWMNILKALELSCVVKLWSRSAQYCTSVVRKHTRVITTKLNANASKNTIHRCGFLQV